ncbi:MAG: Gldg family protein [Proteobacteria bacterium]|nr:Gldg family protein [Pseudomonadota bacterium]
MNKNITSTTGLALAAALFVAIIILANATLTSWRLDLTENKLFTLSEGTLNILHTLEEPVRLDFYFSQKAMIGNPALMNYGVRVRDMLLEYEAHSNGMLELNIIDPEVFSEEEDQAVASGMQSVPLNNAGDRAYFGLLGTNSTDDEKIIPFFHSGKESALEYDITKLLYNLAYPEKRVIGIISSLPIYGDEKQKLPRWTITDMIEEFFEVRDLGTNTRNLDGLDVLMIIHPKDLKDETLFAIDQYVLNGGKAMIFVDPLAEGDRSIPADPDSSVLPDLDSDLNKLTEQWGITVLDQKIVGDINAAMHVQTRSATGPQEVTYLPWLRLAKESFNQNDFATSQLNVIHMGTAGIIEKNEGSTTQFTPLIESTKQSMQLDRDFLFIQRDPKIILDNFKSEEKKQVIAARIQGHAKSAFPEGLLDDEGYRKDNNGGSLISEGDINVIVIADTDILNDMFWIRNKPYFGMSLPQPIANNGDFVINALENLAGGNDLASLRTRGEFTRPFERVETIRRQAELEYREREQNLMATLEEAEQKIRALQQEQGTGTEAGEGALLLTPEQSAEIEKFQAQRIETRKQLRAVQHDLKKNIESLGAKLRFFNIALLPLLIILISIGTGVYRVTRRN